MWTLGRLTVRDRQGRMVVRHIDYAELLQQVQTAAALDRAAAEQVSLATVTTLAERMSHDELGAAGWAAAQSVAGGGTGWLADLPAVWR